MEDSYFHLGNRNIPWVPIAGEEDSSPTFQVNQALKYSQLPILLQSQSLTKSVLCKHCFECVKPMESIGCTFPTKDDKNLTKSLNHRIETSVRYHPLDSRGKLTYPSIQCIKKHEEIKQISVNKSKYLEFKPDNIISLYELTHEKSKINMERKAEKRVKEKRSRKESKAIEEEVNG